mmetsp:Transcript_11709/g.15400  ORF Transcript_11709/g.15400 Transcript_11709/m.15400 type:complete len:128 (-) Transcript_11709:375-758(-)|eukprot:CAMPEP_0198139086 /NCGR_PEP_ID=MMETSP1443-20131203/2428_1 /TAXON_ID=186043 /ORGANISM="Entomoneis sp., Strain CCMP2396" /LENGTH=127 /DNA_ID=CAMNT_0043801097 /DNA_START=35 /DNA_END=418 /DNA_ORIENTATION=+
MPSVSENVLSETASAVDLKSNDKAPNDEDVLYDDLDDVKPAQTSVGEIAGSSSNKIKKTINNNNTTRSLVEEVDYLQDRLGLLEKENEILKRNMGTLYRTAMAEIQRKDEQIAQFQDEQFKLHAGGR